MSGQVSRGRHELARAPPPPRNNVTLKSCVGRNAKQRSAIPQDVVEFSPGNPLQFQRNVFVDCLKSAPSGSATRRVHVRALACLFARPRNSGSAVFSCRGFRKGSTTTWCDAHVHVGEHDCPSEERRRRALHRHGHVFQTFGVEDSGPTIHDHSGRDVCSVPVRIIHLGWQIVSVMPSVPPLMQTMKQLCCPSTVWGVRPRPSERDAVETLGSSESSTFVAIRARCVH